MAWPRKKVYWCEKCDKYVIQLKPICPTCKSKMNSTNYKDDY